MEQLSLQELLEKYSGDTQIVDNVAAVPSKNRLSSFVSDYNIDEVTLVINPGYYGTKHGYFISGEYFSEENQTWLYSPIYFRPKSGEHVYQEVLNFLQAFIEFCKMNERSPMELN